MAETAPDPVAEVLRSGYIGQGPKVEEFEARLADVVGNRRVLTVNSATSGLHLALDLMRGKTGRRRPARLGRRDEVLATPLTCTATNWPILADRLRIRWVDVDPANCNMDLDDLGRRSRPPRGRSWSSTGAAIRWTSSGSARCSTAPSTVRPPAGGHRGLRPRVGSTYQGARSATTATPRCSASRRSSTSPAATAGAIVVPDDAATAAASCSAGTGSTVRASGRLPLRGGHHRSGASSST